MANEKLNKIPGRLARKGSAVSTYRDSLLVELISLNITYKKVRTSANLALFLLKQQDNKTLMHPRMYDVFDAVEDFVYHFDNYCHRVYAYREKMLLYVNTLLKLGFTDRETGYELIRKRPTTKSSGFTSLLNKLETNSTTPVGEIIKRRQARTHKKSDSLVETLLIQDETRLREGPDHELNKSWQKNIKQYEDTVEKAHRLISKLDDDIEKKTIVYLDKGASKNR